MNETNILKPQHGTLLFSFDHTQLIGLEDGQLLLVETDDLNIVDMSTYYEYIDHAPGIQSAGNSYSFRLEDFAIGTARIQIGYSATARHWYRRLGYEPLCEGELP